jgi:hypothetical protein
MLSVTAPQGSLWTARNHQIELSMKILTTEEMRATDARTVADFDVSSTELMENAGAAVARFCLRRYPAARRVVVLCGHGIWPRPTLLLLLRRPMLSRTMLRRPAAR